MLPVSRASIFPSEKEPQGSLFCPYSVAGWKWEPNKTIDGHGAHTFIIVGDEDLMENHGNEIWKLINHVAGMGGIGKTTLYKSQAGSSISNFISMRLMSRVGLCAVVFVCLSSSVYGLLSPEGVNYEGRDIAGQCSSMSKDQHHEETSLGNLRRFDSVELQIATSDLSSENILVEGGFGSVCEGVLHDGPWIAVNRLKYVNAIGAEVQLH